MYFCKHKNVKIMKNYINNIHVEQYICLKEIDISIDSSDSPHLFLTGKNGSGKTMLLNVIGSELRRMSGRELCADKGWLNCFRKNQTPNPTVTTKDKTGKLTCVTCDTLYAADYEIELSKYCQDNIKSEEFVLKMYSAYRTPNIQEPLTPTKPDLHKKENLTSEFLNFLSDLKIQELLANGDEDRADDAVELRGWFDSFEKLMQEIYEDEELKIKFDSKFYRFLITTEGKQFKFTELSDGFAAILEIVIDLILTMQSDESLTRFYKREGIVLIDEVETHLHLALQKNIMPILTRVFPNIQFIVTTHSPFVLSSLPNAVAFDLEHKEIIEDLNKYSYEALAEGYFGVTTESSYMRMRLNEFHKLLEKESWTIAEKSKVKQMIEEFNNVSEVASPDIKGEYNRVMITFASKIRELNND